jgi:hypothetical protein
MSTYIVLREILLESWHRPTGATRHYEGDQELPSPSGLRIVSYPEDPGFYLLYLDMSGEELTDTYHSTLEGALQVAKDEFGIDPADWKSIS